MGSIKSADSDTVCAMKTFDNILHDFGLSQNNGKSVARLHGPIPAAEQTDSQQLNLSLVGSLPSLANALAASQIYELRGGAPQDVSVDGARGHNYLDPDVGMTPTINGQEIPLDVVVGNPFLHNHFRTRNGRMATISAVYVDLVYKWLAFLNTSPQIDAIRESVLKWDSERLEKAAFEAGLPMAIVLDEDEWLASEHGKHMQTLPIVPVTKVGYAPPKPFPSGAPKRPLEGLKILCLTHAIAGPSSGRTLAEHGATVLQVMFTHGFEHHFVYTNANLGCASARMSLHKEADRTRLWSLVAEADVWVDSFRESAISKFGYTDDRLIEKNPNLIISHVRCYGTTGPWSAKAGFDMQASTSSGMMALCGDGALNPKFPPGNVINDYTTGYFGALAIQAALMRRAQEGGAYILAPSLTGTAMAIMKHFKARDFETLRTSTANKLPPHSIIAETPCGLLHTLAPLPQMSGTPPRYEPIVLEPMGSSPPEFKGSGNRWNPANSVPTTKEQSRVMLGKHVLSKLASLRAEGAAKRG